MGSVCNLSVSMRSAIGVATMIFGAIGLPTILIAQSEVYPTPVIVAQGGGTTIVQGGTGKSGGFLPVLTTLGFHAERKAGAVTGSFECLARTPQNITGSDSAEFNVNAMYVTGEISGITVMRDTATLTGTANITGLGAGHDVPFTFVVRAGGPGSVAVLTTEGSPRLVFNETLLSGSFSIFPGRHRD
jgi:hypothetical protein